MNTNRHDTRGGDQENPGRWSERTHGFSDVELAEVVGSEPLEMTAAELEPGIAIVGAGSFVEILGKRADGGDRTILDTEFGQIHMYEHEDVRARQCGTRWVPTTHTETISLDRLEPGMTIVGADGGRLTVTDDVRVIRGKSATVLIYETEIGTVKSVNPPDELEVLEKCPYTFAHTRHWCGFEMCRDG